MSLIAALLCSLAVVDLVRWSPDEASPGRTFMAVMVGVGAVVVLALGFGSEAFLGTAAAASVAASVWGVTGWNARSSSR